MFSGVVGVDIESSRMVIVLNRQSSFFEWLVLKKCCAVKHDIVNQALVTQPSSLSSCLVDLEVELDVGSLFGEVCRSKSARPGHLHTTLH